MNNRKVINEKERSPKRPFRENAEKGGYEPKKPNKPPSGPPPPPPPSKQNPSIAPSGE